LFDTSNQFLIYIRDVAVINIYCLCLGAFVAILSGLSGLGFLNGMGATNAPELKYEGRLNAIKSVNELFNGFINRFDETDCTALTGCDWSKKDDIKRYFKDEIYKDICFRQFEYVVEKCINEKAMANQ
jgi:hypothetical protein